MKVRPDLDYIIVLGAHVAGTRLSKALLERTRRALRYLEENPETRAVLSGGQGQGEQISEAEAMYRYLTEHGIDGSRLILEDRLHQYKGESGFQPGEDRDTGYLDRDRDESFSCVPWCGDRQKVWMQADLSHSGEIQNLETAGLYST